MKEKEEEIRVYNEVLNLVRSLMEMSDAITTNSAMYFRNRERLHSDSYKTIILGNIEVLRNNINNVEKLINAH